MDREKLLININASIAKAGSLTSLARHAGVSASVLHNITSGKSKLENITLGTLEKLLPDMELVSDSQDSVFLIDSADRLSSLMIEDWKKLDEAERAAIVAATKRILKERTHGSAEPEESPPQSVKTG